MLPMFLNEAITGHRLAAKEESEQDLQDHPITVAELNQLEARLERQSQRYVLELQESLKFEVTLKHIAQRVRDSLEQPQVLQRVVEELAIALKAHCCEALLYSSDYRSATIRYHYTAFGRLMKQEQPLFAADALALCEQLQKQRSHLAFCPIRPTPAYCHSAILACPILDVQSDEIKLLGVLCLRRDMFSEFSEMEIRLVQQVAHQCAIALHQAQLYESVKTEVHTSRQLDQLRNDFLRTISHELRSPIASMKTMIQLLTTIEDQGSNVIDILTRLPMKEDRVNQYLSILQKESDRALKLIDDLLYLQQLEAGEFSHTTAQTHLQEWLYHLIEPFENLSEYQQQTLQVHLVPDIPPLRLDLFSLDRIITELLTNACKYTPVGGNISITVDLVQSHATSSPTALKFSIVNTGIEIPAEALPHIFDKFYRVPGSDFWKHGGTGLGLALVKKLVEHMKGSILTVSANRQTQFTIELPVAL